MSNTIFSVDKMRSETVGKWVFKGVDGSKGYRNGEKYKLKVYINHDPDSFFIYTHAKGLKGYRTDDTFYNSHDLFDENWIEV